MPQLYLSPQQSQGRPALPRVSMHEHVGAHQNGLTCSRHLYCTFVRPSLYSVSFNVKMPRTSNMDNFQQCLQIYQASSPNSLLLLNMSSMLYWYIYFPPYSVRLNPRTHCASNSLQSIPQWYFVGGFPQMQAFLSNGKTELHRSGLSPDRHRKIQTRLISASFTCSQDEGAQWSSA